VTVADVQGWRDRMMAETKAPKTLNRRISSLSSFYKYLAGAAAELRLPINVPNPAHAHSSPASHPIPWKAPAPSPPPAPAS
jgi:site-specific recombinase XerD